jgi:hypothetical protein
LSLGLSIAVLTTVIFLGRSLEVPHVGWAVTALAVHPAFWVTSADSSDFVLAALFGTTAVLAAAHGRSWLCGALLGMGCGSRPETALFLMPVLAVGRDLGVVRVGAGAAVVILLAFLPVVVSLSEAAVRMDRWFATVLLISHMGMTDRLLRFASRAWALWGLVSLVVLSALLVFAWRRIVELIRNRDRLVLAVGLLCAGYVCITFVNSTKATYWVPFLPLCFLGIAKVGGCWARRILVASFVAYAIVYPDVVDMVDGTVRMGFRWNNGIVVKDWIARRNMLHAGDAIEQNRTHGESVLVLGYWLASWRYRVGDAIPVTGIARGLRIDMSTNAAYRTSDGAWIVHKLAPTEAAELKAAGIRLAYGEGVDEDLRAQGLDLLEYGAVRINVRELGTDVSEHFTLPLLARCGVRRAPWSECVKI